MYNVWMQELLRLVHLTQKFKAVRRKLILKEEDRQENDAEHSFQLAFIAWYIIETKKLNLNLELVMKYALVHDLVEVYAGDTPSAVHRGHEQELGTKSEREREAADRLKAEFPEFDEMNKLIEGYEEREDRESTFVYALDKILPVMNVYLDDGHSWKVHDIKLEDVKTHKKDKVALSPEIEKYFNEIVQLLERDSGKLFN